MIIGLLMVSHEDDVLEEVLKSHERIVDCFYALDGTKPNGDSSRVITASPKCRGYWTDDSLRAVGTHEGPARDGWRDWLLDVACHRWGAVGNWFLLLHGDEVWTFDPRALIEAYPHADGFTFKLPLYFPRESDGWDDDKPPLEQLRWHLGPGWPEFRMFRGSLDVGFDRGQHFNVTPSGLHAVVSTDLVIKHYLFRSPAAQVARALRHRATGFDPGNYRHIAEDGSGTLWSDDLIAEKLASSPHYSVLGCD